ncbi:ubiquitin-related modifier 1 homolog isoform X1 [Cryptomeria japonica]|uniref:ubiquitin-related modifier 1 homolog isoform X1 n=1 Tax=Cryptomeria japonica TaxID=3369 RepID=UPI0025ACC300|nr:ubiquitin-related modifier 1 homolog isoform X1 [Cryptomeria japonica]
MKLTVEFGGGLELLFQSVRTHNIDVPVKSGEKQLTMEVLLFWIRDNLLKERPEMFIKGKSVLCRRPGVLVLINDCDWELCGQLEATVEENDNVVFISTLHGG